MADENIQLDNILEELRDHTRFLDTISKAGGGRPAGPGRDLTRDFDRLGRAAGGLAESQFTAAKSVKRSTKEIAELGGAAARSAANMAKQWSSTTDDLSAMKPAIRAVGTAAGTAAKMVGGAAQAAGALASAFGPIGLAIGTVVGGLGKAVTGMGEASAKAMTEATEFLLERLSGVAKAFTQMSSVGLTGADAMGAVTKAAVRAGVSIEQWANITTRGAADLGFAFQSATKGAEMLADTSAEFRNAGLVETFRKLGMTVEEQHESIISFAKVQSWQTRQQKMSTKELMDGSAAYMKELDGLAKLTGISRQEIAKTIENQQAELGWGAKLAMMEEKNKGATERVGGAMTAMSKMFGGTNVTEGFKTLMTGTASTEAARSLLSLTGGKAGEIATKYGAGEMTEAEMFSAMQQALKEAYLSMGGKEREALLGSLSGPWAAFLPELRKAGAMAGDLGDAVKDAAKATDDQTKTEDKLTKNVTKAQTAVQDMTNAIDEQFIKMLPLASSAITMFADATKDVVKGMIATIESALGIKIGGGSALPPVPTPTMALHGTGKSIPGRPLATAPQTNAAAMKDLEKSSAASTDKFYDKMYATLKSQAEKAGIANPDAIARLGAAQSSLETGHGKSLAGGNNYFGIKARPGEGGPSVATQEFINGKMTTVQDKFRKYESMEESAADYIRFLQENKRYKQVLAATSAEEAIAAQGKTGYATDPNYVNKLMGIHDKGSRGGFATGGISSGPTSGYTQLLHGTEAIVPLPDGQSIPVHMSGPSMGYTGLGYPKVELADTSAPITVHMPEMQQLNTMMTEQMEAMRSQIGKLSEVVDMLRRGNAVNEKILQTARQ